MRYIRYDYTGSDFQRHLQQLDWTSGFKDPSIESTSSGETFTDVEELEMCNLCGKEITALDEMTVHMSNHILQRDMVAFKNGESGGQMMGYIDNEHIHDQHGARITNGQAFGRGAELRSHTLQHIEQAVADLSLRMEEVVKRVRMAKVKTDLTRATCCAITTELILKFLEPSENCEDEEEEEEEEEKVLLRIKRA
ncbi:hypothetical protein CPB97_006868 [Podila verticillata]|nr:hypothetical protein CPB97_006868 [Podila verticillata]